MKSCGSLLAAVVIFVFQGCLEKGSDQVQFNEREVLKIAVFTSGEIRADSKKVSLEDLDVLLAANAKKNGVVWYYREAGEEEPPPKATEVIKLVVKHKRPISMSSKPDFSDTLDENGNSRPRKK